MALLVTFTAPSHAQLRIRKDQHDLTAAERTAFVDAIWELKNTPMVDAAAEDPQNLYDALTEVHRTVMMTAHQTPSFLPWHRKFIWDVETELLAAHARLQSCSANTVQVDCTPSDTFLTGMPYWDWSLDQNATQGPWTNDFMGGDGEAEGFTVTTGPFRESSGWTVWDPMDANEGPALKRAFGGKMNANGNFPALPSPANVAAALQIPTYDVAPYNETSDGNLSFRNRLEGWRPSAPSMHNLVHVWVDGTMFDGNVSPGDPIFYLHHTYVDRIWWDWQQKYGIGSDKYLPVSGAAAGQNRNDVLNAVTDGTTIADVMDIQGPALGYLYAPRIKDVGKPRDIVIALDVSESMYQDAGFGGLTKLDAAKDALNLLLTLLDDNAGHRVGVVEFNEHAVVRQALSESTTLDFTLGELSFDHLRRAGSTALSDGLTLAQSLFPPKTNDTNSPAILLLTDGRDSSVPAFPGVALSSTRLNVLGLGSTAETNRPLLAELAAGTGGTYYRAQDALGMKKALVASFAETFATGVGIDPFFAFAPGSGDTQSLGFGVNDEQEITVVVGWENAGALADIELVGPDGLRFLATQPAELPLGGRATVSDTFATIQIPLSSLPAAGNGDWQVVAHRAGQLQPDGSMLFPDTEESFFITSVVRGGARLQSITPPVSYTGQQIDAIATLLNASGERAAGALTLSVSRHDDVTGATAQDMLIPLAEEGASGLHAAQVQDAVLAPGNYEFVLRAHYGNPDALSIRETNWSSRVEVGIHVDASAIEFLEPRSLDNGRRAATLRITPQDALGNRFGAGKAQGFTLDPADNRHTSARVGAIQDLQDGTYQIDLEWDPSEGLPDLLLFQPRRAGERYFTPGSLRGESGDRIADVVISPATGTLDIDFDGINAFAISIESARGIFLDHPQLLDVPAGIDLSVSRSLLTIKSRTGSIQGLLQLGAGLLRDLPSDMDLLSDLTIRVDRAERTLRMSVIPAGLVAGEVILGIPEPRSLGLSWLLIVPTLVARSTHRLTVVTHT